MLNEMVLCEELFHTPSGVAFADFITEGHRETWPIRSKRFRTWLRRCYYHASGSAPSAAAIRSALDLLEARAQFDGPERAVNTRVAEHAGRLYLDLADEHWRAVAIGPDGWRVLGCPPVRFRRAPGMLPLPVPERGGSIEALRSFLNLSNQNEFVLVVAWLLAALRSSGPYPLLAISGEQGSAKTVLSKLLRALVDPNAAPVRALPREERELMIAAHNGHLLAFDNLSGLPAWLSDALCRLASGGSFAVRQLYTDDEEVLFKAARPTLLNGIEDIIGRSDLADRAILLTLGPIGEEQRRSETELWREFELARPAILGALLDAAAHGLRAVGSVHLGRLPRMADFALWATACETGLWPAGTFTRAYAANRKAAIESMIDADPIAACVREFMSERPSWTGSAADLLRVSVERSSDRIPRDGTGWPKTPRALAGHLRRAQTFLRALGIEIAFSRQGRSGSRVIRMRSFPENTVSTVSSVSDSGSGADWTTALRSRHIPFATADRLWLSIMVKKSTALVDVTKMVDEALQFNPPLFTQPPSSSAVEVSGISVRVECARNTVRRIHSTLGAPVIHRAGCFFGPRSTSAPPGAARHTRPRRGLPDLSLFGGAGPRRWPARAASR